MTQEHDNWTVGKLLAWTEQFLAGKGIESPRLEAQILLAHVLQCPRIQLYVDSERLTLDAERATFRALIRRRVDGEPVAHLVGYREFYKLRFTVTPDVLIPRPETELLVLEALRLLKGRKQATVLDIGTGSGCIAISIAHEHRAAVVTAVDVSPAALAVARANAQSHHLAERMRFIEGDLFAPLDRESRFDMVLSNPPYISSSEFDDLSRDVAQYEPRQALDGGTDGLDVISRIVRDARDRLEPNGWLLIEIGYTQAPVVVALFNDHGYTKVQVFKDPAGHPRLVVGQLPSGERGA